MTGQLLRLRKAWSVFLALATTLLGAADQFLPVFQGVMPPMGYVLLVLLCAILPSILERRSRDR